MVARFVSHAFNFKNKKIAKLYYTTNVNAQIFISWKFVIISSEKKCGRNNRKKKLFYRSVYI